MKKKIATLIAVILCMLCVPLTAFAEEQKDMVPVVAKVPTTWEAPNLWAWADDGTNAFEAWPGNEMKELGDGWYYCYVPTFVQNVIVNANMGTDAETQTDGVIVEAGKPVWITIAEDKTAEVSYDSQTGEIPAYVEEFVVHAYVPMEWKTVNMWAWSAPDGTNAFEAWPGAAMTEGENGWFTGKAPAWVNSIIINGNEGSVQTEDITIEGKELWLTVYEDLTYELNYEDPDKTAANVKVYAQVPADWENPCCWAWSAPDGTNAFTTWPGEPLTKDGDWYIIEVPGWINSVIINGNEGGVQTTDLSVETGKDVWVVVSAPDSATVSYEAPEAADTTEDATEVADAEAADTEETANTEAAEEATEKTPAEPQTAAQKSAVLPIVGVIAAIAVVGGAIVLVRKKNK